MSNRRRFKCDASKTQNEKNAATLDLCFSASEFLHRHKGWFWLLVEFKENR